MKKTVQNKQRCARIKCSLYTEIVKSEMYNKYTGEDDDNGI